MILLFTLSGTQRLGFKGYDECKSRQCVAGANVAAGHADYFGQFLERPLKSCDVACIARTRFNLDSVVGFAIDTLKINRGGSLLIREGQHLEGHRRLRAEVGDASGECLGGLDFLDEWATGFGRGSEFIRAPGNEAGADFEKQCYDEDKHCDASTIPEEVIELFFLPAFRQEVGIANVSLIEL